MRITLSTSGDPAPQHAVFIVLPRFNMATLITMIEVMRVANYLVPRPLFSWEVASFEGITITASNGMAMDVRQAGEDMAGGRYIMVLGSWGSEHYRNRKLEGWLRKRARAGQTICGIELGCYILARAGLLRDKTATTHWEWLGGFRESFPDLDIAERLFTIDGRIVTSAGALSGVDLMLRLIEQDHGSPLAGEIADQLLHDPIRLADAPQRSTMARSTQAIPQLVRTAIALIEDNIEDPLRVPDIAAELGVSQRQLERHFKKSIGCTLVQFGLMVRLQNARSLLISTNLSVREVATASGFNTLSHFAHAFAKFFGRRPSHYRESWSEDEPTPSWPGSLSDFLEKLKT